MYRAWICEGCNRPQKFQGNVWECAGCGKEICDGCGWMYWTCKPCCVGLTERQVRERANEKLGADIEAVEGWGEERMAVTPEAPK